MPNTVMAAVTKHKDVNPLTLAVKVADVTIPNSLWQHRLQLYPGHTYKNRDRPNTMTAAVTRYNDVDPLTLAAPPHKST